MLSALTVLTLGMIVFGDTPGYSSLEALDPIPPPEFQASGPGRRAPAAVNLNLVMATRTYEYLDEGERRALFRAVIYFCNEEKDSGVCAQYLKYCAGACDVLVRR